MHAYDCAELIGLLWQWYIRPCVIASLTINNCAQAIYHAKEAGYRLRVLFFLLARKCIQKDDTVLCVVYRVCLHSYAVLQYQLVLMLQYIRRKRRYQLISGWQMLCFGPISGLLMPHVITPSVARCRLPADGGTYVQSIAYLSQFILISRANYVNIQVVQTSARCDVTNAFPTREAPKQTRERVELTLRRAATDAADAADAAASGVGLSSAKKYTHKGPVVWRYLHPNIKTVTVYIRIPRFCYLSTSLVWQLIPANVCLLSFVLCRLLLLYGSLFVLQQTQQSSTS